MRVRQNKAFPVVLAVVVLGAVLAAAAAVSSAPPSREAASPVRPVLLIEVKGTIDPATSAYIRRGIRTSNRNRDALLLLRLDTPGGLVDATKDIIQDMLASRVPIAVYVAPEGAMASSAGTFITVAAQVAAMAPTTHIGSATPISSEGKDLERKVTNALASYMKTLAEKRKRNADWATKAVVKGISATADEALRLKVIDIVARDQDELLRRIDGRKVVVAGGSEVIKSRNAPIQKLPMRPQEALMHFLANPNVLGILLLIAMYGIIGEISNPGSIFPGVVGGIALILVLFSSNVLPLSATGLALVVFSVVLFVVDTQVPTHGVLTAGGVLSLALGLFLLVDAEDPVFRMSLAFIIPATLATGAFFAYAVTAGLRAQKRPVVTGHEGLVGRVAEARSPIAPEGRVLIDGAWWTAYAPGEKIEMGEMVRVVRVDGLKLYVTKVEGESK